MSQGDAKPRWYLGIDIGTTGISAVLLHHKKQCLYPISWCCSRGSPGQGKQAESFPNQWFRLPTQMLLHFGSGDNRSTLFPTWSRGDMAPQRQGGETLALVPSKELLNITIPHCSSPSGRWEPEILHGGRMVHAHPLNPHLSYSLPLSGFYQAVQTLLSTLSPHVRSPSSTAIHYRVWGLDDVEAQTALQSLSGVIVGYPSAWTAAYRFNVREAVLGARLVVDADQIMMVGDAIATLLSWLPSTDRTPITLPAEFKRSVLHAPTDCHGLTLVINAGAVTTELAIAQLLPPSTLDLPLLQPDNILGRSLAYAGDALDQDIISQLIYPHLANASRPNLFNSAPGAALNLPSVGEPDPDHRHHLRHYLHQAPLGPTVLQQARRLKLVLQTQPATTVAIATHRWQVTQEELGRRVLLPYIQRLHREVNALLAQARFSSSDIRNVICTGGTGSLQFMRVWLQKTFTNATITQDVYQGNVTPTVDYNIVPTCSRVAYGLAALPLHPQLTVWATRQPCEYDLLMELGRILPFRPLSLDYILDLLKRRGIKPAVSYPCVVALLEGNLPAGLVPQGIQVHHLTPISRQYEPYHRLLSAPLFEVIDDHTYRPNRQQWVILQQYLSALTAGTRQTLFQPLVGIGIS